MTIAQLEQRLETLEKTVERLQAQVAVQAAPLPEEDEIIEGAEYDLTPVLKPHAQFHFQARVVAVERPPARLGLSDAEWASLPLEEEDE